MEYVAVVTNSAIALLYHIPLRKNNFARADHNGLEERRQGQIGGVTFFPYVARFGLNLGICYCHPPGQCRSTIAHVRCGKKCTGVLAVFLKIDEHRPVKPVTRVRKGLERVPSRFNMSLQRLGTIRTISDQF